MYFFQMTTLGYLVFSLIFFLTLRARISLDVKLSLSVFSDIIFIMLLMYSSGGVSSGLGLLLLVSLSTVSLARRSALNSFFAALASIVLMFEQAYEFLYFKPEPITYSQCAMLAISYFALSWFAQLLVKRSLASEALAVRRQVDLANMSLVNQLVIQDMTQGVIVIDENGLIRQSNTAAQTFIGPIQSGVTFLKEIAADLQERIDTWKMATDMMTNPYVFDMGADLRVTLHPVSTSRVVGAVIFLEDLVRVKQEARQLKLVALGRLVANIAHEIRNPLGAISHAAELLAEEPGFSDGARRLTAIIGDNALRLNRMVHDIQALNRGESSRRERIHLLTEIKQFIEQFIATEKLDPQMIHLEVKVDTFILFDRNQFNQVLWNLCSNALRYSSRKRHSIRILLSRSNRSSLTRINVVDDGRGVAPEWRSKLFEPFFTTSVGGTGLGLYLAREFCEANGGMLEYVDWPAGAWFSMVCESN